MGYAVANPTYGRISLPRVLSVNQPDNWDEDEACPVPPELVIGIISRGQTFGQLALKAQAYLNAGVSRVWVVDSQAKTITVFYPSTAPRTYDVGEVLEDELLADLKLSLDAIFRQARIE